MAGAPLPNTACSTDTTISGALTVEGALTVDGITTFGDDVNLACNPLLSLGPVTECVNAVISVAGALAVDFSTAGVVDSVIGEDVTVAFTWQVAPGLAQTGVLYVAVGGSRTITWPPEVLWPNAIPPAMPMVGGATTIFVFTTVDDGVTVYANVVGEGYA